MKKILAVALILCLLLGLAVPGLAEEKKLSLTVSGIDGSVNFTPIYIGMEKGFFKEANLDVDYVLFTNGPVQMESLASNSWDLGFTGVGGVLSGLISYNAVLVGATNTDNGTQTIWVRPDSAIAQAGKGNNTVNEEIVGSAESWKGATVLCNSGTVLEYLLIKTLGGFGLTTQDVTVITMDPPTANSAFLAGEGDSCVITGAISFADNKKDYVQASCGNWAKTGLECSIVANPNSYKNDETRVAMVRFLKVYWKIIEWMNANPDEAAQMCSDFNEECGTMLAVETASLYLAQDPYYAASEVVASMTTKSEQGDYSLMEENLLGILNFFINCGKYNAGDDAKLLNHMDASIMQQVIAE